MCLWIHMCTHVWVCAHTHEHTHAQGHADHGKIRVWIILWKVTETQWLRQPKHRWSLFIWLVISPQILFPLQLFLKRGNSVSLNVVVIISSEETRKHLDFNQLPQQFPSLQCRKTDVIHDVNTTSRPNTESVFLWHACSLLYGSHLLVFTFSCCCSK